MGKVSLADIMRIQTLREQRLGAPVADPGIKFGRGTWRAREREPITGVWGRSPQRGPGAEPLVGLQPDFRGRSPPEVESLSAFRRPVEVAELPHYAYFAMAITVAW